MFYIYYIVFNLCDRNNLKIQELTSVNPDRNIFSINVELTSNFLLYRGLVLHHHRILNFPYQFFLLSPTLTPPFQPVSIFSLTIILLLLLLLFLLSFHQYTLTINFFFSPTSPTSSLILPSIYPHYSFLSFSYF